MTASSTSSTPLEIPNASATKPRRKSNNPSRAARKPRPQDVHSPDALPPAVAALLAITDIPLRRSQSSTPSSRASSTAASAHRRKRRNSSSSGSKLVHIVPASPTEVAIFAEIENEKDLPILSPLEFLLSPPGTDDEDGATSGCDSTSVVGSWTGTGLSPSLSTDSMSSLCSFSLSMDAVASLDSASVISSSPRSKRFRPVRQELEPVVPSVQDTLEHPLAAVSTDDFEAVDVNTPEDDAEVKNLVENYLGRTIRPFKSALKSNLTASLRAIRSAARSISTLNFPSIPPDDFVTRSMLTMDPNIPYTDERRPPLLQETPSPSLRRYLNPTSNARIAEPRTRANGPVARNIPMQTYKIERSRSSTMSAPPASMRMRDHMPSPSPSPAAAQAPPPAPLPPTMRPREMRENPDFIRIAVMEMAMRKSGKLDDNKPGRARWALPPRKCSNKPYAVRADGVPERWVPVTVEN